ncbi:hypothetical protein SAMN02745136_00474 [Anaerocolumna jejuensis DSM 15929]|uniref:Uncharacterized protein n=1 Tax=Anaerocolumna jejuensis DSM 15929 TaxID=1121322 RepID=A0A1M6KJ73_9FIRM|nr:hypothetical protein [Anaerocolumna jejuensis]SHJ59006.1 hypothetical protein SAMN02745136_00474 [Anaerocolumna jejuensis DSM 15929]
MNKVLDLIQRDFLVFLKDLLGEADVDERTNSSVRFCIKVGRESFVVEVHMSDRENYVALTNIMLPNSMKGKGVGTEIIRILAKQCKDNGYDLYITVITNPQWIEGLKKHGGVLTSEDCIYIDNDKWLENHNEKKFNFVRVDGEFVLQDEVEKYKELKNVCSDKVIELFKRWDAVIDIKRGDNNEVKTIIADANEITYWVDFNDKTLKIISKLIEEDSLEQYIKTNQFIGSMVGF